MTGFENKSLKNDCITIKERYHHVANWIPTFSRQYLEWIFTSQNLRSRFTEVWKLMPRCHDIGDRSVFISGGVVRIWLFRCHESWSPPLKFISRNTHPPKIYLTKRTPPLGLEKRKFMITPTGPPFLEYLQTLSHFSLKWLNSHFYVQEEVY